MTAASGDTHAAGDDGWDAGVDYKGGAWGNAPEAVTVENVQTGSEDDEVETGAVMVRSFGLSDEAYRRLFERVATAAHALDEQVFCAGTAPEPAASPPPDSLRARLEALRGLSEAATPGPWRYDIEVTKSDADPMVPDYWCVDINQGDAHNEATVAYYSTLEDPTDDAAFITALVNLYRELLAEDAAVNHVRAGMEET